MTSLYALNRSHEELSNSLNRLSINTNSSTNSNTTNQPPSIHTEFTILKIKNIPRDISFREASLIFSLCLNDVNFIDIIQEPTSNAPVILSKFYSPKIASQVHQLLNDKPLFGNSYPNVFCEIIHANSSTQQQQQQQQQQPLPQQQQQQQPLPQQPQQQQSAQKPSQQQQQQTLSQPQPIPKSNSYLFTNPFICNPEPTSPTSPSLQISKPNNNNNTTTNDTLENTNPTTLIHSLNHISNLNGSSNNVNTINPLTNINTLNLGNLSNMNAWSNDTTSTPLATPLRADPLLLNSSNTATTISNSNLPTPIISDWSQSNNNPNNNYFSSNNLNMNSLATPSSANFSIPPMIHQNLESPLNNNQNNNNNQHMDSINVSIIDDSSFNNDENINHSINQYHSQLQRHHSNDMPLPSPSNQSDILRHYSTSQSSSSNPPSSGNSNSIPTTQQIPELSLLARVPPPANPADQNPPCNTLYVGNLPPDTTEIELRSMFQSQPGFKRLSFRTKQTNGVTSHHGPMCFVEFDDVSFATRALAELYGRTLPRQNNASNNKGGIRLSFSKNPLGVRGPGQQRRNNSTGNNSMIPPPSSGNSKSISGPPSNNTNNIQRNNSLPINNNNNNSNNNSVNYNTSNMNEFSFMNQQYPYQ